jgi:hypothetical protein
VCVICLLSKCGEEGETGEVLRVIWLWLLETKALLPEST